MQNKKSDIVFVFPPANGNLGVFKNHLGVSYLRASLLRDGIDSVQYLSDYPASIPETASDIAKDDPKIAGFTVYDANLTSALALSYEIKRINPDIKIVFGGPSATFGASNLLAVHETIDICVIGEAEETGSMIFSTLLDNKQPDESVDGVAFRSGGRIIVTKMPELVGGKGKFKECTLDNSVSPYLSGILKDGRPGVLSGRGCTHHCQYCCFAALGRKKLRLHSIERVIDELKYISDLQKNNNENYVVAIHDDAFTLVPERAKAICRAIIEKKLNMVLSCITRADAIDEELISLMVQAGFISLAFGLESAVPSVLRATGKVRPPDWHNESLEPEIDFLKQVENNVILARKYGMNVGVSIILGLPSETPEHGRETLRFLKKLPIHYYMHNFLWLFPGTPLWETKNDYNIDGMINSAGLPVTTRYAYDVTKLKPLSNCTLENDAKYIKMLAIDALSSCDSRANETGGLHTVIIETEKIDRETSKWLNNVLDIGGIILQRYDALAEKTAEDSLYEDRCMINDCLVPARHHIQIMQKYESPAGKYWMIACSGVDLYRRHKPELLTIKYEDSSAPLTEWINSRRMECDYCELGDIFANTEELNSFTGSIPVDKIFSKLKKMTMPPMIKYPGRWLKDRSPCLSLSRIEIDASGNIRCCSHGEKIGRVGDRREDLKNNMNKIFIETEKRRGCGKCKNDNCPRCPFPGMEDALYCRIMSSEKKVLEFLMYIQIFSRMPFILENRRDRLGSD